MSHYLDKDMKRKNIDSQNTFKITLYTFFPTRTHSYLEQSHTVAAQQREAR